MVQDGSEWHLERGSHVFAESHTSHCPRWFSLMDEPGSLGLDALAHEWPDVILYAFSRLPLIWKTP